MPSRKNAKPSNVKGSPIAGPNTRMNFGQRMPSSKDSTVPLTAPTANSTANVFDQRRASSRYSGSCVRRYRLSAASNSAGMPTPNEASTA